MANIAIDARIIFTSTGRYVARLLEHLQSIDTHNQYTVLLLKKDFERWNPGAKNFAKIVADYPPYTFTEQIQFTRQLDALNFDLVHFTMPNLPILYRKPYVMTVHDLTLINFVNKRDESALKNLYKHYMKPAVFKKTLRISLKNARHIITPTDYVKHQLQDQFRVPSSKLTRTFEAGDPVSQTAREYTPLKSKKYLLYVGNAYPYKNLSRLCDAFAALGTHAYELVLVGKREYFYTELQKYVDEREYRDIHISGFVEDAQLAWLYKHAHGLVIPSLSEGFCLPGLEAMQYGVPVAAANATCLPEVYADGAIYFDPSDTADMTEKLAKLINDQALRTKLKKTGMARVKEFSWKRMAEQTLGVYEDVLRR